MPNVSLKCLLHVNKQAKEVLGTNAAIYVSMGYVFNQRYTKLHVYQCILHGQYERHCKVRGNLGNHEVVSMVSWSVDSDHGSTCPDVPHEAYILAMTKATNHRGAYH